MTRILIADDSAAVRLTLAKRLRATGHEVVECASFAEASVVDTTGIHRALLDFDLGDGHGIDVAPRLAGAGIPVAFFTSEDDPALKARARKLGPVFKKPDALDSAITWAERT